MNKQIPDKLSLAAKIAAAALTIGKIEKNGNNAHFKYRYQAWDDVVPAVRDACAEHGIWLMPSMTLLESSLPGHVQVQITLNVVDTESPERYTMLWLGEAKGTDDKGFQKAGTSGMKYLLLKLFLIPIHGDEDPDGATPTSTPATGPKKRQPEAPTPAPKSKATEEATAWLAGMFESKKAAGDWWSGRKLGTLVEFVEAAKEYGVKDRAGLDACAASLSEGAA